MKLLKIVNIKDSFTERKVMNRKINKAIFEVQMDEHLKAMAVVVEQTLEDDGLKCADSQRMCILNALNELEHLVNGCELNDFDDE